MTGALRFSLFLKLFELWGILVSSMLQIPLLEHHIWCFPVMKLEQGLGKEEYKEVVIFINHMEYIWILSLWIIIWTLIIWQRSSVKASVAPLCTLHFWRSLLCTSYHRAVLDFEGCCLWINYLRVFFTVDFSSPCLFHRSFISVWSHVYLILWYCMPVSFGCVAQI